jgi:hypothetical protein
MFRSALAFVRFFTMQREQLTAPAHPPRAPLAVIMIIITLIISQLLVNIWMYAPPPASPLARSRQPPRVLTRRARTTPTRTRAARYYSKAVQCCAEVRFILDSGPDGGNCPAVGPCRGFEGNCGQIAEQFASLAVLPDYPNGMAEYTCHLFPGARLCAPPRDACVLSCLFVPLTFFALAHTPDEDKPVDSFIVGLISIAIALPVTLFLQSCFEIANDNEAPESWLEWVGWRKLVFGLHANRRWHYTGPLGQPSRHIKWFIRSVGAPSPETILNLWASFKAWVTCTLPPWTIEAREAAEEEEAEAAAEAGGGDAGDASSPDAAGSEKKAASTSSSVRSARALARYKRIMAAAGFIGTYICWAVFAWCVRACVRVCVSGGRIIQNYTARGHNTTFARLLMRSLP